MRDVAHYERMIKVNCSFRKPFFVLKEGRVEPFDLQGMGAGVVYVQTQSFKRRPVSSGRIANGTSAATRRKICE